MDNSDVFSATIPVSVPDQLILLVDISGSMASMKNDAEGGINSFVDEQKKDPRGAKLQLVEFDSVIDLHDNIDIADVPKYVMKPRGGTALYDAIGKTITNYSHVGTEKVIVVIVTDGEENASREFNKTTVAELIKLRQDQGWEFVFLGASMDTFGEASSLGIAKGSTINYSDANEGGYSRGFVASSGYVTSLRNKSKDEALVDLELLKTKLGDVK